MSVSIKFGDVFEYQDRLYIFLAKTAEVVYAAEILSIDNTSKLERAYASRMARPDKHQVLENIIYCYVILETDEVKDRAAHFLNAQKDEVQFGFDSLFCSLNDHDKKQIKEEILRKDTAIPGLLRELVNNIEI